MSVFVGLQLVGGLALLVLGAESLVRGASRLARLAGVSPLVVGLTVVAFGTSTPELAVSLRAALAGNADIALGNVVGSNIFNVAVILGISALVAPLVVAVQLVRWDVPVMIAVSLLLALLGADGRIGRGDGALLTAGIVAYTVWAIRLGRREGAGGDDGDGRASRGARGTIASVGFILAGFALLVLGADWLVGSAVIVARALGVSDLVIGLTLVAAGTSLPELATSVVASVRGQRDIAVGNVVGSNIFNILAVLGVASVAAPGGIAVTRVARTVDIPVMIAIAVACLPVFLTGHTISRKEGFFFLAGYAAYATWLGISAAAR